MLSGHSLSHQSLQRSVFGNSNALRLTQRGHMSNIIPLNLHKTELATQVNAQVTQDSIEVQPAEFKNVICLKIDNVDVIGYTDKDISYNVIAFASIDLKCPASLVNSESGTTLVPYFRIAPEAVATFNTMRFDAFVPQDKLPPQIVSQYIEYANTLAGERWQS